MNIKELYLKYKELINYLIVGVLTTVVSLAVFYGCVLTFLNANNGVQLQIANIISWICAVTFAYVCSRKFVFESTSDDILGEATKFYLSRVTTLLMDMTIMFVVVTLMKYDDKIAKLISQVVVTVANYVLSKLLVFNNK